MRRGFQLMEIIVALALLAGPATLGFSLMQSNTREARRNGDRVAARFMMADVLEILAGESRESLNGLVRSQDLGALLERRTAHVPEPSRTTFIERSRDYMAYLRLDMETVEGVANLAVVSLTLQEPHGSHLRMDRICRL
jgi:type II secretory pathway pseudopilin PulG